MVLAEFPFEDAFDYLYFSTFHWPRLVNGYSGYTPDSYLKLRDSLEPIFPSAAAIDILRRRGVTHLTINCAMYRGRDWNCDSRTGHAGFAGLARGRLEWAVGKGDGAAVSIALTSTSLQREGARWR